MCMTSKQLDWCAELHQRLDDAIAARVTDETTEAARACVSIVLMVVAVTLMEAASAVSSCPTDAALVLDLWDHATLVDGLYKADVFNTEDTMSTRAMLAMFAGE